MPFQSFNLPFLCHRFLLLAVLTFPPSSKESPLSLISDCGGRLALLPVYTMFYLKRLNADILIFES